MFRKRQLHVELQDNSKEIIKLKCQPHQRISGISQKSNSMSEITKLICCLMKQHGSCTCTVIDATQHLLKVLAHDKFSGFQLVAVYRSNHTV